MKLWFRKPAPNVAPKSSQDETAEPEPAATPIRPKRVVMYCRPGCFDCQLARSYLDQRGIAYTEINIRIDPQAEARLRKWTGGPLITPVFDIDGRIIIDFDRGELEQALGPR